MRRGNRWIPGLISLGAGLLIFLGVLSANSFWTVGKPDIYRLLSDACIASAAFVGGVGVLVFASNSGAFDMLAYGFLHIFDLFRPNARNPRYRDFYEYKQTKEEKREGRRPVTHMMIVGVGFFLFSLIFSMIWQNSL